MISKEESVKFAQKYQNFSNYLTRLDELNIKIWETEEVGWIEDSYLDLLRIAMGVEENKFFDTLEEFAYDLDYAEEIYDMLKEEK